MCGSINIHGFSFYAIVGIIMIVTILLIIFTENGKNKILNILATCVIVALIVSLLYLSSLGSIIRGSCDKEEILIASNAIVPINDRECSGDRMYFKTGYVCRSFQYSFMIDIGDNTFITNSVPTDRTKITYTDGTPRIESYIIKYKMFIFYEEVRGDWIIYVPENSIINTF